MKSSFLLQVAAITALAAALNLPCGITFPMGDIITHSLANSTQTGDFTLDHGSLGAATIFGNEGGPQKWPRDENNQVTIRVCFLNEETRNLKSKIVIATQHWFNRLGGAPSEQSGHALRIKETLENGDPNKPLYCTADGSTWNNAIPIDTLAIIPWQKEGSSATMGWQPGKEGKAWNNFIRVEPKPSLKTLVHEWGHVFGILLKINTSSYEQVTEKSRGMAHEHQRSDRDRYVSYKCENIKGFKETLEKAKQRGISIDEMCNNAEKAYGLDFRAYEFTRANVMMGDAKLTIFDDGPFDLNSIMHYPSAMWGNAQCGDGNLDSCVLVSYNNPDNHWKGKRTITTPCQISDLDVAWIKRNYPWMAAPQGLAQVENDHLGGATAFAKWGWSGRVRWPEEYICRTYNLCSISNYFAQIKMVTVRVPTPWHPVTCTTL